ncbi:MAG: hypothetical protein GWP14_01995 [Actinobacteria bacterium]|nr:hypothetical protein [Actinomycetota bacterium]
MTRLRGRAARGQGLVDHAPQGHWQTTTFLAALRVEGLTAPLVVDGAINGELFLAYVQQQLISFPFNSCARWAESGDFCVYHCALGGQDACLNPNG